MTRSSLLPVAVLCLLLLLAMGMSLCLGAQLYAPKLVLSALFDRDPADPAQQILWEMRLPRSLAAVVTGAALGVSGQIMQALTRNPLADPGLTGVNAGAALAVVTALWLLGPIAPLQIAAVALLGAGIATILVRLLAGEGDSSLRLPLAGAALASLCMALVALIVLLNHEARNLYRFWMVGSLALADVESLKIMTPLIAAGILLALMMSRQIEALLLGAEMGTALGLHPGRVLSLGFVTVTLCAGAAVALAGPVGFIGLIAPHLARALAPRAGLATWIACVCPLGAVLALVADTLGRMVMRPGEAPLGIVLALAGGPCFMLLVRRMLRGRS